MDHLEVPFRKLPILTVSWSNHQCCIATPNGLGHCKLSACFTTGRLVPRMVVPGPLGLLDLCGHGQLLAACVHSLTVTGAVTPADTRAAWPAGAAAGVPEVERQHGRREPPAPSCARHLPPPDARAAAAASAAGHASGGWPRGTRVCSGPAWRPSRQCRGSADGAGAAGHGCCPGCLCCSRCCSQRICHSSQCRSCCCSAACWASRGSVRGAWLGSSRDAGLGGARWRCQWVCGQGRATATRQ